MKGRFYALPRFLTGDMDEHISYKVMLHFCLFECFLQKSIALRICTEGYFFNVFSVENKKAGAVSEF